MFKVYKLDLLIAVYIFCICVAELMGGKTFPFISLGSLKLNASVAVFVVPVIFSINDVITEVYGAARTRSIVRSGLLVVVLIFLFSLLATSLPASARFMEMEPAYDAIFSLSIRISAASLTAFAIAEILDVAIFARMKRRMGTRSLWVRNNASNFIAQFFDTVIFITLAFYVLDMSITANVSFLASLIIPYWLLKCFMSVIETPFVYLGVRWLQKGEQT